MKIAKISNKPISVLLSVLVVLLSFAATGAFSISAGAADTWAIKGNFNSWGDQVQLTYVSSKSRYEVELSTDDYATLQKNYSLEYKYWFNNDEVSHKFNYDDIKSISFTNGTSSATTANLNDSVKATLPNTEFTSILIWIKYSNNKINSCGIEYINAPKDVFTLSFNNGEDVNMTETASGYTYTVTNVEKGNILYSIKKNSTEETSTGSINVPEWDSEVTITCDSDGKNPNAKVTKTPSYVIFDGGNENGLTKNSNMNSDDAKYKFKFENDEYSELGPFTAERNDIDYTYKIAKNGSSHDSYTLPASERAHDNSTVMVSLNVTSNSDFSCTSKVKNPEYKYGDTAFTLEPVANGAGTDKKRYQTTIENWKTSTDTSLQISVNGTEQTVTIPTGTEVKEGAKVTIFWNEQTHAFDFEVKNPDEYNYGDLNGDGSYNVIDAYIIRKIADTNGDASKLQEIGATPVLIELANVDGSAEPGFKVTQADVDLMNDYIVGNITDNKKIGEQYTAP